MMVQVLVSSLKRLHGRVEIETTSFNSASDQLRRVAQASVPSVQLHTMEHRNKTAPRTKRDCVAKEPELINEK